MTMIIVKTIRNKYYLVEYTTNSFIYTPISEDFALQSSLTIHYYNGDFFVWNFHNFVMNLKKEN
jgi:hypothetical protein